jgi:hypothetical protein
MAMSIEPLESRIAPASAVGFTDVDGDHVIIINNGPGELALGGNVLVNAGQVTVNLTSAEFEGANITITAFPDPKGDGLANIGYINAAGRGLGTVSVDGDLGALDAVSCTGLTVLSLGRFGTTTGAPDNVSDFTGKLGKLAVKGEMVQGAKINAGAIGPINVTGSVGGEITSTGDIGAITIGGDNLSSIVSTGGKIAKVSIADDGGTVRSSGDMGPVKIGGRATVVQSVSGDLPSVTIGGTALSIISGGDLGVVKIGGALAGGMVSSGGHITRLEVAGLVSNSITASGDIGPVVVGSDYNATLTSTNGKLTSLQVGGSFLGAISTKTGIGMVHVTQDFGRNDAPGATIDTEGTLAGVVIDGSLVAGPFLGSANIASKGNMGLIRIHGSMLANSQSETGKIDCGGNLTGVMVGGSVVGGSGREDTINDGTLLHEGQIYAVGKIGMVRIGGDLSGSGGVASAEIRSHTRIDSVTIGGSVRGIGQGAGQIASEGSLGSVHIGGDVMGLGPNTGRISTGGPGSAGNIDRIFIGGTLFGPFDALGDNAGVIFSSGDIGSIVIGGNLRGGIIGSSSGTNRSGWGYIEGGHIGSVLIKGTFFGPTDINSTYDLSKSGAIVARDDLGSLTVLGDVIGTNPDAVISARGSAHPTATKDVAIGSINVHGRMEHARILAGYGPDGVASNADAQVGSVRVGTDWISSSLLTGVTTGGDGIIGNANDAKVANTGQAGFKDMSDGAGAVSKIAQVIIGGSAIGTISSSDALLFGIEAQQIGSVKLGGAALNFKPGPGNDLFAERQILGPTRGTGDVDGFDFHAFEVPKT